jgi:cysteine-rich secretory family protein
MTLTRHKTQQRLSSNQRKRLGQHHNQGSRHYAKTYWPYLPVFAVLLAGLVFNTAIGRQHHSVLGYATDISPEVLLQQTNGERVTYHEPALTLDQELTNAAQAKANDMAKRNYWSHVTPEGIQPWAFVAAAGYQYEAAGENLAYGFGTSEQVMTAWMNSPEHRANILNGDYQDVGFATANVANYRGTGPETIIVAMYGEQSGMVSPSTNALTSKAVPLGTQSQPVSRLQLIDATQTAELFAAAIAGAALALFFVRHALAWHRVLVRGERFFVSHPFFDVVLMSFATLVFVYAHVAGVIL